MTLLSRFAGYLRDVALAILFGATGSTDAFYVAFRIPNLLRRLFAEGGFSQAFVPIFTEYKERHGDEELKNLLDRTAGNLGLVLFVITVTGIVLAPLIITLFAPGFLDNPAQHALAVDMLRITFPYVLFISLTAMAAGVLNTCGKFAVPAFTPVLLNLSLIGAAVFLAPHMKEPVTALAWGVFVAGFAQLAFQIPALMRLKLLPRFRLPKNHAGVKRIRQLMLPALFGSSVAQVNILINTLIASFLATGSISWLYYSDRFVELPLALFGVTTATVILPQLSRAHSNRTPEEFVGTMRWALALSTVVALPATVGLVLLAGPIMVALVQYRAFTPLDAQMSAYALMAYATGLPAFVLVKVLTPGFYSRQNTRTPVKIAVVAVVSNMLFNALILGPWIYFRWPAPHAGLALATALAGYVNMSLLYRSLKRVDGLVLQARDRILLAKMLAASAATALGILYLCPPLVEWFEWSLLKRVSTLTAMVAAGGLLYVAGLALLGVRPKQFSRQDMQPKVQARS